MERMNLQFIFENAPDLKRFEPQYKLNAKEGNALVYFDVDQFIVARELFGAFETENALRFLGGRIAEHGDLFCRVAADTFAAIVPLGDVEKFMIFALHAIGEYPIRYKFRLSFGIYPFKSEVEPLLPVINKARDALISARKSGAVSAYFSEEIERREEFERELVNEASEAIDNGEFRIYLQPICEMTTKRIIATEALARWVHPKKGIISPALFIPLFERGGLIAKLDDFVLRSTCRILRDWLDGDYTVYPISVNISRINLYDPELIARITETVDSYGIPHSMIDFELPETSFVFDNKKLIELTTELQRRGFKVLMDNFGRVYSSLNSLKLVNVDVLKIDLKFLPSSVDDKRSAEILKAVIEMAKVISIGVIFEGVETKEQLDFLIGIGSNIAQGYFFHRPMPLNEFEAFLDRTNEQSHMTKGDDDFV